MSAEPDILLRDVCFAYGRLPVLENVNLTIGHREAVCMVGPNGGGKTTLVKLMLGLLRPDEGEVRIFGESPQRARLRVGYMPQHLHYDPQFPVTVLDLVLMGRLGRGGVFGVLGWYGSADRKAALQALGEVGMEAFARRPFRTLSGGQRQRVLIARALCCRPDLLLLDEPTAHVDARVERKLFDILREKHNRMTILVVSHDLGFVSSTVQRVICVNRRVVIHPTGHITGEVIRDLYGGDVRMVRHDDHLSSRGPEHG